MSLRRLKYLFESIGRRTVLIAGLLCWVTPVLAVSPVSRVRVEQQTGTPEIVIQYDLDETESNPATVTIEMSDDGGRTFHAITNVIAGDVGAGVVPGQGKRAVWTAGAEWLGRRADRLRLRVNAQDPRFEMSELVPGVFAVEQPRLTNRVDHSGAASGTNSPSKVRMRVRTVAEAKARQEILSREEKLRAQGRNPVFETYDQGVFGKINGRWIQRLGAAVAGGVGERHLTLDFKVREDGSVLDCELLDDTIEASLAELCVQVVTECAPLPRWTPEMSEAMGKNTRKMRISFVESKGR